MLVCVRFVLEGIIVLFWGWLFRLVSVILDFIVNSTLIF